MVQFESLANELLLDLFEFLDTTYLIRAFLGLNSRFDQLLYIHFQTNYFSFQSISKEDFDIICQQHLLLFIDKIISFRLSNEETPNLSELILSQNFTINRFIHLQSLSLYYIKSLDTLIKITFQCRYLIHLTHLEIINNEYGERYIRIFSLFDNIWNIPNLIYCNLNGIQKELTVPPRISSIAPYMKYLSIKNIKCNLRFLSGLFECTPNLQHLCSTIKSDSTNEHLEFVIPSMISLELSFEIFLDSMKNILEKMPNLYYLTIETSKIYLDGNEWEHIIINYLPKIKIFRLKINFEFSLHTNKEEQIDQILNTFRSTFWLEKHQWFVRCHWNPYDSTKLITLYTLPYAFKTIHYSNEYYSKSTCFDEEEYRSYDHVRSIFYQNKMNNINSFNSLNHFNTHFPYIQHLSINIPYDNNFLHCFQSLNILTSLEVFLSENSDYYQLQTLLNQTLHLYSLKLISDQTLNPGLFHLTSKSIYRLDLIKFSLNGSDYFNDEDCNKLIDSPLGLQCEVLFIRINNRTNILHLIKKMSNLRLLVFECKGDRQNSSSTINDELVQWLKNRFLSIHSIIRDRSNPSYIQVWINRQKEILNNDILISKIRYKNFRLLKSNVLTFFPKFSVPKKNT
ncbi:unnamed protein product [Rotaria sordida]|uniref:F-box domain-containing protein n=1 Tax=Rotaria sordida TaxID=392033 RepID=A0A815H5Z6_9BILA|nr:unnamed protein product [Rotaria sordida]CAF3730796.1 unnamed protein product [Rotaria sordida]